MQGHIPAARQAILDRVAAAARRQAGRGLPVSADSFVRMFYRGVSEFDLAERQDVDMAGAALAQLALGRNRRPGRPLVRVFNPVQERDGFDSSHTVIMVICDDMPFLVDSLGIVCSQSALSVHLLAHPVLSVTRDRSGRLRAVHMDKAPANAKVESWQMIEVDRVTDAAHLKALERRILDTLDDVRYATSDWRKMRAKAKALAAELGEHPPRLPAGEVLEAKALLEWMEENHFTFLGYREYRLKRGRHADVLEPLVKTGLGLMSAGRRRKPSSVTLRGSVREFARSQEILVITKANTTATVHRATYLDYVGVKTYDAKGQVTGEKRFIGLWTSSAYSRNPREIPVLRHKVDKVIEHYGLKPSSHDGKAVMHVLETFPRDELFQASVADLIRIVRGIVNLYERSQVRLFVRRDVFRRFYSCMVFVPRDRYNTQVRERIEKLTMTALGGESIESQVQLSESALARVHLLVRTSPESRRRFDIVELEEQISESVRTWQDHLKDKLLAAREEADALRLLRYWGPAFPAAYQENTPAKFAVPDIACLEALATEAAGLCMSLYRPADEPPHKVNFKLFRQDSPVPISDVLPAIENLGLKLISGRTYELNSDAGTWWIQDFELEHPRGIEIELDSDGPRFKDTFAAVWSGRADNDGFNRLVLAANLTWREAMVLRTYARWFVQLGLPLSQAYMEEALATNAEAAGHLLRLFIARFDPALGKAARKREEDRHARAFDKLLADVSRIDDDRILRAFRAALDATLRTNFFQPAEDGQPKPYLSLKLNPRAVPETPQPKPMFEIFMHSPRVEGVHLRMGRVARGGLRWSDRREDFRTEILGLMKAQNVKNTVIVPVGAKGGFVPRRLPASRDEAMREGTECYRIFIRSLLDITDNVVAGKVAPPPDVVRRDVDDPYLVVAADKGTASFSDVANGISDEYRFWMGDAFASGGSAGYDHKGMAITARGAWEAVKRHFRELGLDTQAEDFTVAGIGDMAGDVFGNGMLLSPHIRLQAAFNHQHIFLDPDPEASKSFAERQRLFNLPRSSWEDYNARLISKGGGLFSRQSKSLALSAEARTLLGLDTPTASPNQVIKAILKMPVDLLWNGGIGTYVKSADESHADIGDRANDAVRVDGGELRCRVIGEGGNLGFSQRGRIEFAVAGGRVNTDFIDNSGGVNCSDVEVNIKILLNSEVNSGKLKRAARDRLLARMTDEVAALVLRNNYLQSHAISTLQARASERVAEHGFVIRALERSGVLDRALESLPTDDDISDRQRRSVGLTRPELAMLLSYSKLWLYDRLIESNVPEDSYLGHEITRYFPKPLQKRYGRAIQRHQLHREIIVMATTNSMVNRMGPVFVIRTQEDTGADVGSIARAYTIAREVASARELWADIEALDNRIPAALQYEMAYESSRLLRHLTYWVLRNLGDNLDVERAVSRLQPGNAELVRELPNLIEGLEVENYQRSLDRFGRSGVPERVARRVASLGAAHSTVDIVEVALQRKTDYSHAARVYFGLGQAIGLDWIRGGIERLVVKGHWQAVARGTLREEAYSLQRRLAEQALAEGRSRDAAQCISAWRKPRAADVDNLLRTVEEMRSTGAADFPTLSVALQAVRRLRER